LTTFKVKFLCRCLWWSHSGHRVVTGRWLGGSVVHTRNYNFHTQSCNLATGCKGL